MQQLLKNQMLLNKIIQEILKHCQLIVLVRIMKMK
jgi:hypothetical protein